MRLKYIFHAENKDIVDIDIVSMSILTGYRGRFKIQKLLGKSVKIQLAEIKPSIKAIPIKCFVSPRPLSRESGSVGGGKKKE